MPDRQRRFTRALRRRLAAHDFTSSERGLEAPRGFLNVLAARCDTSEITRELGSTWELMQNAYKPYPCGIVIHPVRGACQMPAPSRVPALLPRDAPLYTDPCKSLFALTI